MTTKTIDDPTVAGWELNPDTGYWMWAAASGGGGGSIQDGDTEGQITTWSGDEWTPEGAVVVSGGNVGINVDTPTASLEVVGYDMRLTGDSGSLYLEAGTNSYMTSTGSIYLRPGDQAVNGMIISSDGRVDITGSLFVNGVEVGSGGGGGFWVEESPGVIKYTGTAKATDVVATG